MYSWYVFLCRCIFFLCLSYRLCLKYPVLMDPFIEILGSGQHSVLETSWIKFIRYNSITFDSSYSSISVLSQHYEEFTERKFSSSVDIVCQSFTLFHRFECGLFLRCWYPAEPHDHRTLPCKSCSPCLFMIHKFNFFVSFVLNSNNFHDPKPLLQLP